MKSIKLALLLLILHLNVYAMHQHESSSIVPNKKQELTIEQQEKISDELSQKTEPKKESKLELVNNFRRECLNKYLSTKDLSNIVLDYADIDTKYSYSNTIKLDPDAKNIFQLQDGSLASCSRDGIIKIWILKEGQYYLSKEFNTGYEGINNIFQLHDGSLAVCEGILVSIWTLKEDEYCLSNILGSGERNYFMNKVIQLIDGSLIFTIKREESEYDNKIIFYRFKNGQYHLSEDFKRYEKSINEIILMRDGSLLLCSNSFDGITNWVLKDDKYCLNIKFNELELYVKSVIELQGRSLLFYSIDGRIGMYSLDPNRYHKYQLSQEFYIKNNNNLIGLQNGSLLFYSTSGKVQIYILEKDQYSLSQEFYVINVVISNVFQFQDGSLGFCSNNGKIEICKNDLISFFEIAK